MFQSSYRDTPESLTELPAARVPTAFLFLSNFQSCFYNLIETQYNFCLFLNYYYTYVHLQVHIQVTVYMDISKKPVFTFVKTLTAANQNSFLCNCDFETWQLCHC